MKSMSYESMRGQTVRTALEGSEDYLIATQGNHVIDLDFRNRVVRLYSNNGWAVHSMDVDHRTKPIQVLKRS